MERDVEKGRREGRAGEEKRVEEERDLYEWGKKEEEEVKKCA